MDKEELKQEAEEKYHNHKIVDFQGFYNHHYYYLGYVESAEPREKQIEQLTYLHNEDVNTIKLLNEQIKTLAQNLEDTEILNKTYEKRFSDLEKENAELKNERNAFKIYSDGAEFGYNKANEWPYVKDGDLPKDDKEYLVLYYFNYRGKKETHCGVRDNLHNDFEIHRCYTEQIIAWKEIVLPKE